MVTYLTHQLMVNQFGKRTVSERSTVFCIQFYGFTNLSARKHVT